MNEQGQNPLKNVKLCSERQRPSESDAPCNDVSNAERILTNFKDALGIKKQVGKLQVAVDNKMVVAVLNALQQLEHQAFDYVLEDMLWVRY